MSAPQLKLVGQNDPPPQGTEFIPAEEAARRAGLNPRHVVRLCGDRWFAQGLARTEKVGKTKPTWFVSEAADPRFARVRFADQLPYDGKHLTEAQRAVVFDRLAIVKEWEAAVANALAAGMSKGQATDRFLEVRRTLDGKAVSQGTLYIWRDRYRAAGPAGLEDDRWKKSKARDRHDDPFFEELRRQWLVDRAPTIRTCYHVTRGIASARGWTVPSYHVARRYLNGLHPFTKTRARKGADAYANECRPHVERDYESLRVNQVWCGDHHQCDAIVEHKGKLIRPWLSAFEDLRSRRVFYTFVPHAPNTDTVLFAFRAGVLATDMAVPEEVYVDNGKDYDAYALQGVSKKERFKLRRERVEFDGKLMGGVFGGLGVKVVHAQPYNAKAKPVERFFGTFESGFGRLFPTYCGNKPDDRPASLEKLLDKGPVPTFDDYVAAASAWIEGEYHQREHTGHGMDGRTPLQAYEQLLTTKRTIDKQSLELCLLKAERPVKVARNGVRWEDRVYGQGDPALMAFFGKQVLLRTDPTDVTAIVVTDLAGKFITRAACNQRLPHGCTREEYRQHGKLAKAADKIEQDLRKKKKHLAADPLQQVLLDRAAERKRLDQENPAPPPADPPSLKPIQTPFAANFDAIQKAFKVPQKRAVGAESLTGPTPAEDLVFAQLRQSLRQQDRDGDAGESSPAFDPFRQLGQSLRSQHQED